MRLNMQSKPSVLEFLPFTKDIHQLMIWEKYTHVRALGLIAELDWIDDAYKQIDGCALYPHICYGLSEDERIYIETTFNEHTYDIIAPPDIAIDHKGALFPIASGRLQEMYPTLGTKFYLMLDRMNNKYHRQLSRKIQAGKGYKPTFRNIMKRK